MELMADSGMCQEQDGLYVATFNNILQRAQTLQLLI